MSGLESFFGIPVVRNVTMFTIGTILFLIFTRKAYKQSKQRLWNFQNAIHSFVISFSPLFEDGSSVIKATMGKDELFEVVVEDMIRTAKAIVQGQIMGIDIEDDWYQLGKKNLIANTFGFGREEWSIYFTEARKAIDPYELFVWEI